jgi:two-component system NtrC family sensor kinase
MRLTIRLKVLLFTLAIIVVLMAILYVATSTLVAQNLEEQLRKRAELALDNVEIWLSDQKERLLRQAELLSSSPLIRNALYDPNPLFMNEFEQMDIASEIEMMLVENVQYDWLYQLCKNPVDPGSRLKSRREIYGDKIWNSSGVAGYIPIRGGLVLAVTVPVGSDTDRLALLTLGDLLDQTSREDLVIMSGTQYVHLVQDNTFFSTTLSAEEAEEFQQQMPGRFDESDPYYISMGNGRFLTMSRPLFSPVHGNSEPEIAAYLVVQFGDMENRLFLRNVTTTMFGIGGATFVIFAFISVVFSGRLTNNLKKLVGSISAMGEGDYSTRVAISSSDEIGLLANSFDQLRVKLWDRTDQLLRANKDLDNRVHEMESLNTVLVAIASEQDLEEVFTLIAMEAAKQFPMDYAFLALRREFSKPDISVVAHHSMKDTVNSYPHGNLEKGMVQQLTESQEPVLVNLNRESQYPDEQWLFETGLRSAWLLPLGEGERIGFLCLASISNAESNTNTLNYLRKLATEITVALQRFRINEELQLIESRLQRLFDSMRDGIIQTDNQGLILVHNKAAGSMLQLANSEVAKLQDFFVEASRFSEMLELLEQQGYVSGFSARMKTRKSEAFDAELSLAFSDGDKGDRGLEGTIRDVSTRKRLEDQLVRSERLASMGQIAASVAHEINNPLGIILGFTQDLISEKQEEDPDLEALSTIEEETRRCARIVKDLLDLARADKTELAEIDLKLLIEKSMPLFKLHFRDERVTAQLELEDVDKVLGDEKQIQQVLINVILNSIHALKDDGGTVTISLYDELNQQLNGRMAVVAIEDTGSGINQQDLEKVFDPFFTTKRSGGSGLGLFIVHRLIDAHGGQVSITSEPGVGTRLEIRLPIAEHKNESQSVDN